MLSYLQAAGVWLLLNQELETESGDPNQQVNITKEVMMIRLSILLAADSLPGHYWQQLLWC